MIDQEICFQEKGTWVKVKGRVYRFVGEQFEDITAGAKIESNPPSGECKVTNLYVNPTSGKLVVEYDDVPGGRDLVESNPPAGNCKVTNVYIDIVTGKFVVKYETIPV